LTVVVFSSHAANEPNTATGKWIFSRRFNRIHPSFGCFDADGTFDLTSAGLSLRATLVPSSMRHRAFQRLSTNWRKLTVAAYGVGAGAEDPPGTGDGASVEPCVFGGFLRADLLDVGVGDGLLIAAVLVLVPVFPDCSHDARNAMPIRTAIREIRWFFIGYTSRRKTFPVVLN
jgi:hypothetical protein